MMINIPINYNNTYEPKELSCTVQILEHNRLHGANHMSQYFPSILENSKRIHHISLSFNPNNLCLDPLKLEK